jgi:hypothetical protein
VSEARVFLVSWDVDRFQAYVYDLTDERLSLHEHMLFDGLSKLETWEPLPVYSDQPHLVEPDIWYHTDTYLPVMSDEVVEQLEPFISRAGELLPLVVSETGETVYMLNVLVVRNAVEPGAYNVDDLSLYPRFIEHRLPDTGLFKLPQLTAKIFYVEREDDEDTLIQRLENGGLRGMSFIPVWSSSEGPASLNLFEVV